MKNEELRMKNCGFGLNDMTVGAIGKRLTAAALISAAQKGRLAFQ
jgi:hypothetical protein